jgi:deoxyribose-phosphate aldolase
MNNETTRLILRQEISDKGLQNKLSQAIDEGVKEVFVLPNLIYRTKMLVAGKNISVGSFIDFPLSAGTLAKQAYETGELFRLGADVLQFNLPLYLLETENWDKLKEIVATLRPISFGRAEIRFYIHAGKLKEIEKIHFARIVEDLGIRSLVIEDDTVKKLRHDLSVFQMEGATHLELSAIISREEIEQAEMLKDFGAKWIATELK